MNEFRENFTIESIGKSFRENKIFSSKLDTFFENEIVAIYIFSSECKLPFITTIKSNWYKIERMYFLNVLYTNNVEQYIEQYPSTIEWISRREFRWWKNIHTFCYSKMTPEEIVQNLLNDSDDYSFSIKDKNGNELNLEDKDGLITELRMDIGDGIINQAFNNK